MNETKDWADPEREPRDEEVPATPVDAETEAWLDQLKGAAELPPPTPPTGHVSERRPPLDLDPDCRDGKHRSCTGGPCECECHGGPVQEPPPMEGEAGGGADPQHGRHGKPWDGRDHHVPLSDVWADIDARLLAPMLRDLRGEVPS